MRPKDLLPADVLPDDVAFAGVAGQAALLRSGALTSVQLVDGLLARTARVDQTINAFRTVRAAAVRAEAAEADSARAAGDARPLLGVPFAVKDNLDVAGETTTHGVGGPHAVAAADSPQVAAFRAAGMLVLGKTNLPELALWPFTETPAFGVTRNPWDSSRTCGGSSGGSGAAVAAGLVPAATASDGGGSIRIPAACCGLVGLKPTRGLVDSDPPEHWYGLSVGGVLTRTVTDTALLLDVLAGAGLADQLAVHSPLRVGWTLRAPTPVRADADTQAALTGLLDHCRDLGHTVRRVRIAYGPQPFAFLPRMVRGAAEDLRELPDRNATERRTRSITRLGRVTPGRAVRAAQRRGEVVRARVDAAFDGVDVVAMPVMGAPAIAAGRYAGHGLVRTWAGLARWMGYTPAFNVSGHPALSVPAGWTAAGLPLAVQLVGPHGADATLLQLAQQLEERIGWPARRPTG